MAKIIVTHFSPDLDAIGAIWLLKRFDKNFADAVVTFATIGQTYREEPVDSNQDIVHVDTGYGRFDHHQLSERTSATKVIWESLGLSDEPLKRLVAVINDVDNAIDLQWPEAMMDRTEFLLANIIHGWKQAYPGQDQNFVTWGLVCLDGVYKTLCDKAEAEKLLKEGTRFKTRWGDGIALTTANDTVLTLGEKQGASIVVRQDPKINHLRVYSRADKGVDLTQAYEAVKKQDPEATWFLHSSKCLLLNGSRKDPKMKPTKLSLEEIITILEKA